MNGIENYWGFLLAGIVLNLTPGADTLYVLTRTLAEGRKAGIMSVLGTLSGVFLHILAVSLGLAQVIAHSPMVFNLLKYAGAIYLLYLGIKAWRTPFVIGENALDKLSHWHIYRQGLITNLLNPKIVLFFLALLPQFVSPNTENTFLPFMLLGLSFLATTFIWYTFMVFAAAPFGTLLRNNRYIGTLMNRLCGVVFIGLGLKIALER